MVRYWKLMVSAILAAFFGEHVGSEKTKSSMQIGRYWPNFPGFEHCSRFFEQFQLVNLLFSTYWKEKWRLFSGSIWFVFLNYNDGWIHRMPLWSPFQLLSWPGSWKMHVWSNLIPRWHGRLASSLLVGHWYGYVHRQEVLQLIETSCVWMSIYLKSIQPSNRPR